MTYDNDKGITLHQGDYIEVMATLPANSVDSIVCDPPYGLEFMGKAWDKFDTRPDEQTQTDNWGQATGQTGAYAATLPRFTGKQGASLLPFQAWCQEWATEALRVLKPGGHLLAFGGTRTYHRLACGIEDAGFEVRDSIHWIYGSGFPKSMNVAKAIDKEQGIEGERGEMKRGGERLARLKDGARDGQGTWGDEVNRDPYTYVPGSEAAAQWDGWGTALKPAHEPVIVARKPLIGTVAANVQAHGTGALNIDGCRVGFASEADEAESKGKNRHADFGSEVGGNAVYGDYSMVDSKNYDPPGRWPANVIFTHSEGCQEVGTRKVKSNSQSTDRAGTINTDDRGATTFGKSTELAGAGHGVDGTETIPAYECVEGCPVADMDAQSGQSTAGAAGSKGSSGFAAGYDGKYDVPYGDTGGASRFFYVAKAGTAERNEGLDGEKNTHPTVKPVALMRYLCKLVTPPGGTVLDPFAGSGTCGVAAIREGFRYAGIEMTPEYVEIAIARLESAATYLAEPQAMF